MRAVFDTNILIDFLNGTHAASEEFEYYDARIISIITYMEVLIGAQDADEENTIRGFLTSFEVIGLSSEIAETAIGLRRDHGLKIPDAVVYGTARVLGCMLVTQNTRDFKTNWPDIRVPYTI